MIRAMKRLIPLPLALVLLAGGVQAAPARSYEEQRAAFNLLFAHRDCVSYHDRINGCGAVERAWWQDLAVNEAANRAIVPSDLLNVPWDREGVEQEIAVEAASLSAD